MRGWRRARLGQSSLWEPPVAGVAMAHQILREQMARRRGGTIGIKDKGAVALRFDHGLNNFRDLVLPLLRKYELPSSQAYPTRMFTGETSDPDESSMSSWDEVRQWAERDGVEPLAHSLTHYSADTPHAVRDAIVLAREELTAVIPGSAIETWAPPGGGGTRYMGFNAGSAPDRFYDTLAGAMILSTYGYSTGAFPGWEWSLDGCAPIGMPHSTIDTAGALAAARGRVREIVENRTGCLMMLHPKFLTYGKDYTTVEGLDSLLAYIAGLRNVGKLEVMTVGGLAHARTGSKQRLNLVAGGRFHETSEQLFDGMEDWMRVVDNTRGIPRGMLRNSAPSVFTQSISNKRVAPHRGAIFEIAAQVRSRNGAVAVIGSHSVDRAISEREIPGGNRWHAIRQYVTLPLNSRDPFVVAVGSSRGALDVVNLRAQPI